MLYELGAAGMFLSLSATSTLPDVESHLRFRHPLTAQRPGDMGVRRVL